MHSGMDWWTRLTRDAAAAAAACFAEAGFAPGEGPHRWAEPPPWFGAEPGAFGVRRPLRFLIFRLGLDEAQIREVARILDELKTERAQAAVDHRRMSATLADLLTEDSFDAARAAEAAGLRVQAAERMRQATVRALDRIHRVLRPEQRATLAMLVRTGAIVL